MILTGWLLSLETKEQRYSPKPSEQSAAVQFPPVASTETRRTRETALLLGNLPCLFKANYTSLTTENNST